MQLGMIGTGRMGGNMAIRLMKAGHEWWFMPAMNSP